ncbi:MAG TPA: phospholipase D-like domain-containing protein [Myxococcales bacterium]|nr:phospholipase D-like domain-containing protein [Myxococcales bacterium]
MKTTLAPRLAPTEPARPRAGEATPAARPPPAPKAPASVFERSRSLFKLPDIGGFWDRHVERPFVMGRDGFVAVDDGGKIVGGQPPSARVRDHDFFKTPLDPLLEVVGGGEKRDVTYRLPGGQKFSTRSDDSGATGLPMNELARADLRTGVDPKRGGVVSMQVETPNGQGDESNVLVLPKDYDGPIFVCDIDDTLRDTSVIDIATGKTQRPIDGARELLQSVAAKGIPIVYLSAGTERIRNQNEAFLDQLPKGVLLDRDGFSLSSLNPSGDAQARDQALYKAGRLADLEEAFPRAQLFGLGDDKYGDAMAYTRQGVTAYIHDVIPGDDHLPADFHGVVTKDYTPEFRQRLDADLDAAIARSSSFGGKPGADDWSKRMDGLLDRLTGTRATDGNKITPLVDGDAAFPEVLKTIDGAKRTLYYETFEFHGDNEQVSREVVDHLIAAKQRGVTVRVATDAFGSGEIPFKHNAALDRLRKAGIEVTSYNPIDSVQDLDIHRDHRKVIVADNQTAFVGGMNTGDAYMGKDTPWRLHDVFARVQGPAVKDVVSAFYDSWAKSGGSKVPDAEKVVPPAPESPDGVRARIVTHAPHEDQNIRAAYLAMFDNAKERINVENTFPMSGDLVDSLVAAAQRGVEVRYVVDPSTGLKADIVHNNFQRMLDAGVHIYVYPGPIHTKAISVDGKLASVGSSNVDNMALYRDREIVAMVEDPDFVKRFDAQLFDRDVVGKADGQKTMELPKKLDTPFWTRLRQWAVAFVTPDSYE